MIQFKNFLVTYPCNVILFDLTCNRYKENSKGYKLDYRSVKSLDWIIYIFFFSYTNVKSFTFHTRTSSKFILKVRKARFSNGIFNCIPSITKTKTCTYRKTFDYISFYSLRGTIHVVET